MFFVSGFEFDMAFKVLSLISLLSLTLAVHGQSWDSIKKDSTYIWGEGKGSTVAEADRNALSDLTSKITTHVSSTFDIIEEETSDGKKVDNRKSHIQPCEYG